MNLHARIAQAMMVLLVTAALVSCHSELKFNDVGCGQDTDCPLSSLHCLAGACVACFMDQHCTTAGFPRCDLALHRCVQCGVAADCAANQTCKSERCMTLCAGGCPASMPRCDDSVCGQCDTDDGVVCASPTASHCSQHLCVGCLADRDCGGTTPWCDVVTAACVQCQSDTDCPSNAPYCDVGAGMCVNKS